MISRQRFGIVLTILFVVAALSGAARAQVITEQAPPPFPDPKKFARGFFATGDVGTLVFFGRTGQYARPGFLLGARLGYDVLRWLAVQARFAGATSSTALPPPTVGQSIQTYLYDVQARFSVQLRRVQLFAEGGVGIGQLSSNVLDRVQITTGQQVSLAVVAGGGVDLHTLNRHFSLGLAADYLYLHHIGQSHGLTVNAHLKYTH